ncbi:hypothetical protein [Amycolatopsis sp. CA-126428]|uniref:hypothetical protein n=1 Tax=Amycolatopsis sp. CA-126428 TaxID=2073158 RepID=UPI00130492A0|nr:hypothetical protein [Amycolatopsis sp. CA-126428]
MELRWWWQGACSDTPGTRLQVRRLLQHNSGLPDYADSIIAPGTMPFSGFRGRRR